MLHFGENPTKKAKKAATLRYESPQLEKRISVCEKKQARRDYQDHAASSYHSTSSYRSTSSNYSSSSHSDGLCFITTAACQALNDTDDCEELMMLRKFRDTHLQSTSEGEAVVREYYRVGPLIVDCINKTDDLPLVREVFGRHSKEKMARFTLEEPLKEAVQVELSVRYQYGDIDSYRLIAYSKDYDRTIQSTWYDAESLTLRNPAPSFSEVNIEKRVMSKEEIDGTARHRPFGHRRS